MKYKLLVTKHKHHCYHSAYVTILLSFNKIPSYMSVLLHCHCFFFFPILLSRRYKEKNDEIRYINSDIICKENNHVCFRRVKNSVREVIERYTYTIIIDVN